MGKLLDIYFWKVDPLLPKVLDPTASKIDDENFPGSAVMSENYFILRNEHRLGSALDVGNREHSDFGDETLKVR